MNLIINDSIENNNIEKLQKFHENLLYTDSYFNTGYDIGNYLIDTQNCNSRTYFDHLKYLPILCRLPDCIYNNELTDKKFLVENPKPEHEHKKYNTLNPSIFHDKENNKILINVRNVNFFDDTYESMDKSGVVKTKNLLGIFDIDRYKFKEIYEIKNNSNYERINSSVLGFEDLKIFKYKDYYLFVCTSYETCQSTDVLLGKIPKFNFDSTSHEADDMGEAYEMVTYNDINELNVTKALPLLGEMVFPEIPEKNWMPIISKKDQDEGKLKLVYSVVPELHIVEIDMNNPELFDGKCIKVKTYIKKKWDKSSWSSNWRGSSNLISFNIGKDNGYLFLTHEVYFTNGLRNYVHRICWINSDWNKMLYSDPLLINGENRIEYCNGIEIFENDIYITYGDNDKQGKLLILNTTKCLTVLLTNLVFIE